LTQSGHLFATLIHCTSISEVEARLASVMLGKWKQWVRIIKRDAHALYLAARDPRVPWYAKALAITVAGYALSPIDLIPDFVPVLGYVDDLIIVPLGIALVIRLIPPEIIEQHRDMASAAQDQPVSRAAAVAIVTIWIVAIGLILWIAMRYL
jgi:uncharacterized membrane protein YkvA (DUF1232 family)